MRSERTKNSAKNMISGFLYQFLNFFLSFVARTLFIRILGTELLGVNGLFSDVLSLLSMADLGFGTAMSYSFYQPLAENDTKRIQALIIFYRKIYIVIAVAMTVLGLACVPFLDLLVNTDREIPYLTRYYLFALAGVICSYLFVYKTTLLTADQKNYKLVKINMATSLVKTAVQLIVLLLFRNYLVYLGIGVCAQLANNVISSKKVDQEYPYLRERRTEQESDPYPYWNIWENMKSVFIYKLSSTLLSATDNILISLVVSTAAVGLYSNYLMISARLILIEQIVFSSLTASIGNVIVRETEQRRYEIFEAMQSVSFIFCGIVTSTFCILINDLIHVWLGAEFVFPMMTVIAISANTYLTSFLLPVQIFRDAAGLYQKTKYVMLLCAVLNLILSFWLGRYFGIAGVIAASVISRLLTYVWYEPDLLFRGYFGRTSGSYYLGLFRNGFLVSLGIVLLYTICRFLPVQTWAALFFKSALVGSISTVFFMGCYWRTAGMRLILKKIRQ